MKLLSRDDKRFVFFLSTGERQVLLTLLGMDSQLPIRPRPLSRESGAGKLEDDEELLHQALDQHRVEIYADLRALLTDGKCCVEGKGGFALTLDRSQLERMLQAVNGLRVGAWDRMGSPDFEAGERPEPGPQTAACISVLRATDLFIAQLLGALDEGY